MKDGNIHLFHVHYGKEDCSLVGRNAGGVDMVYGELSVVLYILMLILEFVPESWAMHTTSVGIKYSMHLH